MVGLYAVAALRKVERWTVEGWRRSGKSGGELTACTSSVHVLRRGSCLNGGGGSEWNAIVWLARMWLKLVCGDVARQQRRPSASRDHPIYP